MLRKFGAIDLNYYTVVISFLLLTLTSVPLSNAQTIFGVDDATESLLDINESTGEGSFIEVLDFTRIEALACDTNSNTLFGADIITEELVRINPRSGTSIAVGNIGAVIFGMAYDPNTDTLYAVDTDIDQLVIIDTETGSFTPVGLIGFRNVLSLAFDRNTNTLYGVNPDLENNYLITIDTETGEGTMVGDIVGFEIITGLTFDEDTNTLYASDELTGELLTVNTQTAKGTVVGEIGFETVSALARCEAGFFNVPTLSEWGLIAMAGVLGLIGFIVLKRRKAAA